MAFEAIVGDAHSNLCSRESCREKLTSVSPKGQKFASQTDFVYMQRINSGLLVKRV